MKNQGLRVDRGNLEKRIKRHVKAQTQLVAGICHPAWEDLAAAELANLGLEPEREDPGVLVFSCSIQDVYRIHLQCRLFSSFRIRLKEFRCGAREDLFSTLRSIPWEYWLKSEQHFSIKLSLHNSRLSHEGRAGQSAWKAVRGRLDDYFGERPILEAEGGETTAQKIFIRIEGSRASVSVDASGELLHRRGYLPKQGNAPLRETLAAAIFAASPFDLHQPIVDGMAGSGTFLAEAILSSAALWPLPRRSFAFEMWPVFNPAALANLRSTLEVENSAGAQGTEATAVEMDPEIFRFLKSNMQSFSEGYPAEAKIHTVNQDFFAWIYELIQPSISGDGNLAAGTIILNPPYHWRIAREQGLYRNIWNVFSQLLVKWQGIVLVPLADNRPDLTENDLPPADIENRLFTRDFPQGGRKIRAYYIASAKPM